jgi:hypothetical protein
MPDTRSSARHEGRWVNFQDCGHFFFCILVPSTSGIYFLYDEDEFLLAVGGGMPKKNQHMTKNQKLDALRVDIAKTLQAVEMLTRRLEAVIPTARKATKKVRRKVMRQARPVPSQAPLTEEDEDDKAVSIAD